MQECVSDDLPGRKLRAERSNANVLASAPPDSECQDVDEVQGRVFGRSENMQRISLVLGPRGTGRSRVKTVCRTDVYENIVTNPTASMSSNRFALLSS